MRFAALATTFAAVLAVPLVWGASAPSMSGAEFLSAARCAAYQGLTRDGQGWVQAGLNAEARRQPAAIVAEASAEVSAIAAKAAHEDEANLRMAREAACASALGRMAEIQSASAG